QRIVSQSRAPEQKKSSSRQPDRIPTNNVVEKRFHVSIAMEAPQLFDADRRKRPRAMRKERRHGRIAFLLLLAAFAAAGMLLISHLHSGAPDMAGTSNLDVAYVARLARINLSEDEAKTFQKQLDDVLKYVEKLRQLDVTDVEATAQALPVF